MVKVVPSDTPLTTAEQARELALLLSEQEVPLRRYASFAVILFFPLIVPFSPFLFSLLRASLLFLSFSYTLISSFLYLVP